MTNRTSWLLVGAAIIIISLLGLLGIQQRTKPVGPAVTNQSSLSSRICDCLLIYEATEGNQVKTYAFDLQTRQRRAISYNNENRLSGFPSPNSRDFVSLTSDGTKLLLWSSTFQPSVLFEVSTGQYILGSRWSTDGSTVVLSIGAGTDYESASAAPQRVVAVDIATRTVKSLFTKDDLKAATQEIAWGVLGVADDASAMILSAGTRESGESFWQWSDALPSFRPVNANITGSIYLATDPKNEQLVWSDHNGLQKLAMKTLASSTIPIRTQSDSPVSDPNRDGKVMVMTPSEQGENPVVQQLDLQTGSLTPLRLGIQSNLYGFAGEVWTPDGQSLLNFDIAAQEFSLLRLDGTGESFKDDLLGPSPMTWMLMEKTSLSDPGDTNNSLGRVINERSM